MQRKTKRRAARPKRKYASKGEELKGRFKALFGDNWFWGPRVAKALGKEYSTIKRWVAGTLPIPEYVMSSLELLELVPEEQWPERWRVHVEEREAATTGKVPTSDDRAAVG
jgi:hypothetical protein